MQLPRLKTPDKTETVEKVFSGIIIATVRILKEVREEARSLLIEMPPPPVSIQKRGLLFFPPFFAFDITPFSGGERAYKKKGKGRRRDGRKEEE